MTSRLARDPARRCMPLEEWPEQDRQLWLAAVAPGDLLEAGGTRSSRAASSNHAAESGYGRFLAWLAHAGRLDPAQPLKERLTQRVLKDYLEALSAVNSTATQLRRLEELHIIANAFAPRVGWQWIRDMAASLRRRHQPTRDKRSRIVGIDDLETLGLALIEQASLGKESPLHLALLHRDGLAIALLIARPLRRTNFAQLRLDEHLQQRGDAWWLMIPGAQTKNGGPIEMPFPVDLLPHLDTYFSVHRPFLLARRSRCSALHPPEQALWVSHRGTAMGGQALYDLVVKRTRQAFGKSLSPHLFRDCAATGLAIEDPAHVAAGSALLGHRSQVTMERHYNQAGSVDAARKWHRSLAKLQKRPAAR